MAKNAVIISVLADTKNLGSEFGKAEGIFGKFAKAGAAVAAVGAAVATAIGVKAVGAASELEQNMGALNSVFKEQAQQMEDWANSAASSLGLAKSEYAGLATVLGSQLRNMGVSADALSGQTNDLIGLGADLAAQFGGSTSDAVSALSSLLRGERDPIERYGVSINEAAVNAKLAEMGLSGLTGEAEKNAKLQATLALLTQQTADAQGAFAREANTLAGAQQRLSAGTEDLYARLGSALLPAVTAVTAALGGLVTKVSESQGFAQFLAGVTNVSVALQDLVNTTAAGGNGFGAFLEKVLGGAGPLLEVASYFTPIGAALHLLEPLLPPLASAFMDLGNAVGGALVAILPVLANLFQQVAIALVPILAPVLKLATTLASSLVPVFESLAPVLATVGTLITNLMTVIAPVIDAVVQLITPILSLIAPLMQLVEAVLPPLVAVLTMVAQVVASVLTPVIAAITPIIQSVVDILTGLITFLTGVFTGDWEMAWQGIQQYFKAQWDLIWNILKGVWDIIVTLVQNAVNQVLSVIQAWGPQLLNFIKDAWNNVMSFFGSIPGMVQGAFAAAGQWLLQAGVNIIVGLYNGIKNWWTNVTNFFGSIPGLVGGAFAGAGAWLASAGRNIIDGLVNGLRNAAGSVGKTLLNIAKDAIDGFKSFFGIKSPSRLMMGLGKFLPQGLAKGITNGLGYVTRAMGSVNDAVTGNFSPSLSTNDLRAKVATAGGFGSSQTNINVSVDGGISTAPEIGRAVVEAIKNYQATGGRQAVLA